MIRRVNFSPQMIWALVDQGILSAGNLLTTLLLARFLSPETFGSFILVFNAILFFNSLHYAVICYRLIVRGASSERVVFAALSRSALSSTLMLSVVLVLLLVVGSLVFDLSWPLILSASLVLYSWQYQSTLRSVFISRRNFRSAIPGDAASWMGRIVLLSGYVAFGGRNLTGVFLLIAATNVVAILMQSLQLRVIPSLRSITKSEWWEYLHTGRWILLGALVTAATAQSLVVGLAHFRGTPSVAGYQAILTILGITNPVTQSLSTLLLPTVATAFAAGGLGFARERALITSLPFLALLAPVYLGVLVGASYILRLLYGHDSLYAGLASPARWVTLAFVMFFMVTITTGILNGSQHSGWSLASQAVGAIASIGIGIPLIWKFGLAGAAIGMFVAYCFWFVTTVVILYRLEHGNSRIATSRPSFNRTT